MAEDVSSARTRELGARLRQLRIDAGMDTGATFAAQLGWSPTKVSRLESGFRPLSNTDATLWLGYCQAMPDECAEILELAVTERAGCWVRPHGQRLAEAVPSVALAQDMCTEMVCYDPVGLPAILQAGEYREEYLLPRFDSQKQAMAHDRARFARHELLHRRDRPAVTFFLRESVLRGLPVPPVVRSDQLLYMALLTGHGHFRLRVVPVEREPEVSAVGFQVLRFAEDPPVVCVPTQTVTLLLEGNEHVSAYQDVVTELEKVALPHQESQSAVAEWGTAERESLPPEAFEDDELAASRSTG